MAERAASAKAERREIAWRETEISAIKLQQPGRAWEGREEILAP